MEHILALTERFVKEQFQDDVSGHDWYHMLRVRNYAKTIRNMENDGNQFIVEMAALLHDIPDEKLDIENGRNKLNSFLNSIDLNEELVNEITNIIDAISFKGGNESKISTIEAKIVRDADRLDAIGAIGIARTFAYGGKKGQPIYDPFIPVRENMSESEYRNGNSTSIHHFFEKLLKLKDLMTTTSGRKLAEERHRYIEEYLMQFFKEWKGEI